MHGKFLRLLFLQAHQKTEAHFTATDDDVLYLFVQKQKSAQRYISTSGVRSYTHCAFQIYELKLYLAVDGGADGNNDGGAG